MPTVIQTAAFIDWLTSLKDVRGGIKITARLLRLSRAIQAMPRLLAKV
jgi:putative component of toxin-antitoxin plasmid stabilization module